MNWISFALGALFGSVLAFVLYALCVMAGKNDPD